MTISKSPLLLIALCVALAPATMAQKKKTPTSGNKKLYCWNENGQRVCSDSLPPGAENLARDEISARSGLRTGQVQRALNEEERALAESDEVQRQVDLAALETRKRTDQAMLSSYQTEDQLRRVFGERISIVENSIRTARYNVVSLREGLVSMLQTAGDRELDGKPVNPELANGISGRHRELLRQQQLQAGFERQRAELDVEIADIMQRYRELKGLQPQDGVTPAAPAEAGPTVARIQ